MEGLRMARVDLASMTLKQLLDLEQKVKAAIALKRDSEASRVKDEIAALAGKHGFSLRDLGYGGRSRGVTVKYRNRENSAETWTGRGRMPNWLSAKLAKGAKREDFLV